MTDLSHLSFTKMTLFILENNLKSIQFWKIGQDVEYPMLSATDRSHLKFINAHISGDWAVVTQCSVAD